MYKTSILVFKDRDRYVTGEFRFRNGYCKNNPRKMVKLWAEKEYRNLNRSVQEKERGKVICPFRTFDVYRLRHAGIPCPEPVLLRSHVLAMRFIGKDGW